MPSRRAASGAPVFYDEAAHREFVTGFRRRKQARRQSAAVKAAAAEKEARRQERRAKREVLRTRLVVSDDDDDDRDEENAEETTYQGEGAVVVTASVVTMETPTVIGSALVTENKRNAGQEQSERNEKEKERKKDKGLMSRITGIRKPRTMRARRFGKQKKVSYTHLMSNKNRRKAQLRRRSERKNDGK